MVDQQTGVTPWNLIGIPDQITEIESSMNGKIFYTGSQLRELVTSVAR